MRWSVAIVVALSLIACRKSGIDDDGDGFSVDFDCDDANVDVNPNAGEVCNTVDDNCNGVVDESASDAKTFVIDSDGDGYGNGEVSVAACSAPAGYTEADGDCDDADADIYPTAPETDCESAIDSNCDGSVGYSDADHDGWPACKDCNDASSAISPAAAEACDGIDNNCDEQIDEAGALGETTWYADTDADTFGDPEAATQACEAPSGRVANSDDCDDTKGGVHPGADETCDTVDENCNGVVDENPTDATPFYLDADNDGTGGKIALEACDAPTGYVATSTDCDDLNPASKPGAAEICDGKDNDCDSTVPASETALMYADADGDGHGTSTVSTTACLAPTGYVAVSDDCDDVNAASYPSANEICDGKDNNCDSAVPASETALMYADADGDGHGNATVSTTACLAPTGYVATSDDCDDVTAATHPSASEICDGKDNNCDGAVPTTETTPKYLDADGDSYGNKAVTGNACTAPSNYVTDSSDCDDTRAAVSPGAAERPGNALDDDCAGNGDWHPMVYTIDRFSGDLWAVDRVTGTLQWTVNTGHQGIDVTVGPDGTLYVGGYENGAVYKVDPTTHAITTLVPATASLVGLHGLNYDFANDVILGTNPGTGVVVSINPTTGQVANLVTGVIGSPIDAMRFAGDPRVYITTRGTPALVVYTPSTGLITTVVALPVGPNLITGSPERGKLFTTSLTGHVYEVDLRRKSVRLLANVAKSTAGSCADPMPGKNLILGDHLTALWKFDTTTAAFATLKTGLGQTWGCATDAPADNDGDGFVARAFGGDDCDDLDADVNPGETVDAADGVDRNCDGVDGIDADGDGAGSLASGGTDCDDTDVAVYMGKTGCSGAASCLEILQNATQATDGTYQIDPLGTGNVPVYCDMTNDGGGWTRVVNIRSNSIFHADATGAVGTDVSVATNPAKLSDAAINALTTVGYWRYECGTSKASFVTNTLTTWTSTKTNAMSWSMDNDKSGTFECTANRAGYVFSDWAACGAGHSNYAASAGAAEGNGCYTTAQGWNLSGALWAR